MFVTVLEKLELYTLTMDFIVLLIYWLHLMGGHDGTLGVLQAITTAICSGASSLEIMVHPGNKQKKV